MSFISREQIDLYDLSSVADLGRVVAGVYTPARYGIEGSIDIRGVPADTYLRGMKRVVLQGNARSVLAAMDVIEVVKGPPSPIFGLGKIGGYTNFVPKSGRAGVGGYLPSDQGFFETIVGTYDRREFSGGVGGPIEFGEQEGRLLRLWPAFRLAVLLRRDAVQHEDAAGRDLVRQLRRSVPPRNRRDLPGWHHRRRAERPRHAGARRRRDLHQGQPAGAARSRTATARSAGAS